MVRMTAGLDVPSWVGSRMAEWSKAALSSGVERQFGFAIPIAGCWRMREVPEDEPQ